MLSNHYSMVHERDGVHNVPPPLLEDGQPNPFAGQSHRRVLVTGGTGFIGRNLVMAMLDVGHAVTVLSRHPPRAARMFAGRVRSVSSLDRLSVDDTFDCVINLAGAPVVGIPWTARRRAVLTRSRIGTTQALMAWMERTRHRPAVWVQASAIGAYGVRDAAEALDESSTTGSGFMSQLCMDWEASARPALDVGVRQVVLRFGLVFGRGGALPMMLMPYRFGLGARIGNARQVVSWIHLDDVIHLVADALEHESMSGIYNAVAPETITQGEFAETAARLLDRPLFLRLPAAPLRLLTGEMGQLFLDGQRVVPARLLASGYTFTFPTLSEALTDLV